MRLLEAMRGMWVKYNPNPTGRNVEDCSVRAISKALGISWEDAYDLLTSAGFQMGDMPHSNSVIGAILRMHGFYRASIPNRCPDCYTAGDFAREHPHGIYVLGSNNHIATIKDGVLFDSFDSSGAIPQFFWYKKEA